MADEMMKATTRVAARTAMLDALPSDLWIKYATATPMAAMTTKTSAESELLFLISTTSYFLLSLAELGGWAELGGVAELGGLYSTRSVAEDRFRMLLITVFHPAQVRAVQSGSVVHRSGRLCNPIQSSAPREGKNRDRSS
jgi:hypothetical protein